MASGSLSTVDDSDVQYKKIDREKNSAGCLPIPDLIKTGRRRTAITPHNTDQQQASKQSFHGSTFSI
ncbi:MAG: hypothetical protein ABGX05_02965 [Pirellulaceae bacterium]